MKRTTPLRRSSPLPDRCTWWLWRNRRWVGPLAAVVWAATLITEDAAALEALVGVGSPQLR